MGDFVVFAPLDLDAVGLLHVSTRNFTLVDISHVITGDRKFGGAAAVGDLVVFAPEHADAVGLFNVTARSFTIVDIRHIITGIHKFCMGAEVVGDLVVFPPSCSTYSQPAAVGLFDVTTRSMTLVDFSHVITSATFAGSTVVGDLVVFAPKRTTFVGLFNVTTRNLELVDISILHDYIVPFDDKFYDAVAIGSLVVFTPANARHIGHFDLTTRHFTLVDISHGIDPDGPYKFQSSTAIGNLVVFAPHDAAGIGLYDPSRRELVLVDMYGRGLPGMRQFYSAITIGDTAFFVPWTAAVIGLLRLSYCDAPQYACSTGSYRAACGFDPSLVDPTTHTHEGLALLAVAQLRGACTPCTTAVAGVTYYTSAGSTVDDCPTAACDNATCSAGHFRMGNCGDDPTKSNNAFACPVCPMGTYQPLGGALTQCAVCKGGTYQNREGALDCKASTAGHFCPLGATAPLPCRGGTWSAATNLTDASQCSLAEPGHFAPTGSDEQFRCRPDTYNPNAGESSDKACKSCPPDSTTNEATAQVRLTDCVCTQGHYNTGNEHGQVNCTQCPSGSDCHQAGFTLHTLYAQRNPIRGCAALCRMLLPLLPTFAILQSCARLCAGPSSVATFVLTRVPLTSAVAPTLLPTVQTRRSAPRALQGARAP